MTGISDDELARNYAQAQVAVVPSLYEGFSLPAIEAMACGVPLVATTGGALPEVVGTDGETGLLVPPDDPGALAAAIGRLLDDAELRAPPGRGRPGAGARPVHLAGDARPGTPSEYRALDGRPGPPTDAADRSTGSRRTATDGDAAMLTVDYARLGVRPGRPPARPRLRLRSPRLPGGPARGRGGGLRRRRRRGAQGAGHLRGHGRGRRARCRDGPGRARSRATPCACPSPTASFDRVIASEVLEHIPDDDAAMAELARVLRPGGTMAVTVPRCGPEFVNWALSDEYHNVPGGHVRIYRQRQLVDRLRAHRPASRRAATTPTGSTPPTGGCAAWSGPTNDDHPAVAAYHRLLVWDIEKAPKVTRYADRVLNPLVGKSLVVYLEKPASRSAPVRRGRPAGTVGRSRASRPLAGAGVPREGRSPRCPAC